MAKGQLRKPKEAKKPKKDKVKAAAATGAMAPATGSSKKK